MKFKPNGFVTAIIPVFITALAVAGVAMFEKQNISVVNQVHDQQKHILVIQENLDKYYQAHKSYPVNLNQVDAGRGVLVNAGLVPAEPELTAPQWRYWSDGKSYKIHYFLLNNNIEQVVRK